MVSDHDACLVRIWRRDKSGPVGGGCFVGKGRVVTCAHVAAAAACQRLDVREPPREKVLLDFPILAPGQHLQAEIRVWSPPDNMRFGLVRRIQCPVRRTAPKSLSRPRPSLLR